MNQKPPRELANILSCFDARFSALTQDCKDIDDVIAVMIDNVTFVDYGLLKHLANATNNLSLASNVKDYESAFQEYWMRRHRTLFGKELVTSFKVDKETCILPDDSRTIEQLKVHLQNFLPIKKEIKLEFPAASERVRSFISKIHLP